MCKSLIGISKLFVTNSSEKTFKLKIYHFSLRKKFKLGEFLTESAWLKYCKLKRKLISKGSMAIHRGSAMGCSLSPPPNFQKTVFYLLRVKVAGEVFINSFSGSLPHSLEKTKICPPWKMGKLK